jgi:hypothetical protein
VPSLAISTGLALAASRVMWLESAGSALENAFSILRFRRRGVVSFRRFVVFHLPDGIAKDLRFDEAGTQPVRVVRDLK